jgi:hypothetical protein
LETRGRDVVSTAGASQRFYIPTVALLVARIGASLWLSRTSFRFTFLINKSLKSVRLLSLNLYVLPNLFQFIAESSKRLQTEEKDALMQLLETYYQLQSPITNQPSQKSCSSRSSQ